MKISGKLKSEAWAIEPNFASHMLEALDDLEKSRSQSVQVKYANNGVVYEKIENVGLISIEGTMYKREIVGLCESVASYEAINTYIKDAEADESIDTIVFRVDTNGGSVAGADEVRANILSSEKRTIVYADNMLASAGMWIFSAADELYASDMTQIGSIGVIIVYEDKENNVEAIVSSNAPNKYCDIRDEGCKEKIQARLDEYESKFFSRLEESFSKTKEELIRDFNAGATIFADAAYKLGYVKDLMMFDKLLSDLIEVNNFSAKIKNKNLGENMATENVTENSTEEKFSAKSALAAAQEKMEVAVSAKMTENTEVMSVVFDAEKTVNDVKAVIFDIKHAAEEAIAARVADYSDVEEKIDDIDAASDEKKVDFGDEYLKFAQKRKGEIK